MQPTMPSATVAWAYLFQSSPVPEDGCNEHFEVDVIDFVGFNPHPSRRTGATSGGSSRHGWGGPVSILTRPGGRVQPARLARCPPYCEFQSSPVPEDGCNRFAQHPYDRSQQVSILTRPGGRVQPRSY